MCIGQLSGRRSLRDVVDDVSAQQQRLYHLGSTKLSRSNLSRINEDKPYQLYEAVFGELLKRCRSLAPGHGFRFKNELYSMEATTIDLCFSLFPWATFRKAKSGINLHVAINHKGNLPQFVTVTDAKQHEVNEGRLVEFPKGSIVAFDRGYTDYEQQILRLLETNLFEKWSIDELLHGRLAKKARLNNMWVIST